MNQNLKRNIFGLFDSAEFYFLPKEELEASQSLLEHCRKAYPVNCIVGPEGTGRTAAAFWIYHSLAYAKHEVIYISKLDPGKADALLRTTLTLLGYQIDQELRSKDLFKKLIDEAEDIQKEGRSLLFIVDDPGQLNQQIWRQQIEPILAINNIQEGLFSFLFVMSAEIKSTLEQETMFDADVSLQKSYLRRDEMKDYLYTRLKGSEYQDLMINDEELDRIYEKTRGHFSRVNELASVALQKISEMVAIEVPANSVPEPSTLERQNLVSGTDANEYKVPVRDHFAIPATQVHFQEDRRLPPEAEMTSVSISLENPDIAQELTENNALQPVAENAPIVSESIDAAGELEEATRVAISIEPEPAPVLGEAVKLPSPPEPKAAQKKKDTNKQSDDSWNLIETLLKSS